jgi:hypothetical protein
MLPALLQSKTDLLAIVLSSDFSLSCNFQADSFPFNLCSGSDDASQLCTVCLKPKVLMLYGIYVVMLVVEHGYGLK